ncbi:hypothetical protein C2G38_2163017 [Gigaspora rosea]|uniref:Uncharacterized protein n=1 Tax=Gigaspora rosea TaxID=44941 RepID=A0A397VVI9_9GLOM|nr:hypothetical protein C2G38_2163017 [Gigaspora rosea]
MQTPRRCCNEYHIKIINFLPSLTPEDRMIFGFVASGVSAKNCSFYASLHTNSILIEQTNKQKTSQTEKNSQMNELTNNQTDEQKNNQTNNQKNNQIDNINRNINKNNKFRAEKSLLIAWTISFLYNPNSSTQIKSGAAIRV